MLLLECGNPLALISGQSGNHATKAFATFSTRSLSTSQRAALQDLDAWLSEPEDDLGMTKVLVDIHPTGCVAARWDGRGTPRTLTDSTCAH